MTERGIIMSAPMVRAILEGRKTQTRRLSDRWMKVKKGDRLWLRETHAVTTDDDPWIIYKADSRMLEFRDQQPTGEKDAAIITEPCQFHWRPSIHMPRWASRITLEATEDARRERLQDIRGEDAQQEGIDEDAWFPRRRFERLWFELHRKPGERWEDNPIVTVLSFQRVE